MISRRDVFKSFGTLTAPILLSRADAQVTSDLFRYRPEIEPLVVLIEQVPRAKAAELLVEQLRRGVPYRQLMAALFLAGIRNVNPRPPGFALHCVFVMHSAHLISLEAPPDSRLLPLFYAMDNFKAAQERDAKAQSGDYTMRALQGSLPAPEAALTELSTAMEAWDIERAERAVVSAARHRSSLEIVELLRRYGARDYRNIGHKAIYVANASRTLDVIGWQHSEPVLRSLVLSLLDFGREQEVNGYKFEDQCYRGNLKRVKESLPRLPAAWARGEADATATREMLETFRSSTPDEACTEVTARVLKGKNGAGAVWDAVHLAAAELAMRTRASGVIVGIHAVTSANALHELFMASSSPETRFLLLLQAVGWMGQFRTFAETREKNLRTFNIAALEPGKANDNFDETLAGIFAGVPASVDTSAGQVFGLAENLQSRQSFLTAALRVTLTKAEEVHYYKYLAALIEDIGRVNTEWQPHMTAAVLYYAKGSNDAESAAMKRAREALRSLPA